MAFCQPRKTFCLRSQEELKERQNHIHDHKRSWKLKLYQMHTNEQYYPDKTFFNKGDNTISVITDCLVQHWERMKYITLLDKAKAIMNFQFFPT